MNRGTRILTTASLGNFIAALLILNLFTDQATALRVVTPGGTLSSIAAFAYLLYADSNYPWLDDINSLALKAVINLFSMIYLVAGFLLATQWYIGDISGFYIVGYMLTVMFVAGGSIFFED